MSETFVIVCLKTFFSFFQLITSPEVIELLIRIMQSVKNEGDDRWRKISRAVTVILIRLVIVVIYVIKFTKKNNENCLCYVMITTYLIFH